MTQSDSQVEKLKLEQVGREVCIPAGVQVVRQGEIAQKFYVVLSGKLKVYRETPDGIRTDLTILGPGAYFGEVALVTGTPRTASVEAVEESTLLEITEEEFDQVLDQNPKLARQIISSLAKWLVEGDKRLEKETVHQVKLRQISLFDYVLILGLSLVLALVFNLYNDNQIPLIFHVGNLSGVQEVPLKQAEELYKNKQAIFVDARKSNFYEQEHIKGALNLPVVFFDLQFPMFQFMLEQEKVPKDEPLLVYGGTYSRRFDLELARLLKEKDYNVMVLQGDYSAWKRAFPLERHKAQELSAMPLDFGGYLEWLPVGIFVLILIPPVWRSPYLSGACRLILGIIFVLFALSKIMRPAVFALNVVDYDMMPSWGVNLWSLFLPWAEMMAGLFLILGIRTRAAATVIGGMNIIFIVGLVHVIMQGLPITCGCVGEAGEPVTWWKVLKNTGMLVMSLQIFLYDRLFTLDRGGFIWRERKI
jgi:putative oxidoreductase|uniref:Cyclic nucleotide-binding domain-containing protein n=1 Tax=Desulfobacca acetoxidans TaxID=60893 RepID=A0A7V6DP43_9BACT